MNDEEDQATNGVLNAPNAQEAAADAPTASGDPAGVIPTMMSSFFPSPPSYISSFTPSNVALARRLIALPSFSYDEYKRDYDPTIWKVKQGELLLELGVPDDVRQSVADTDLVALVKPPEVELIEQDGHWMSFGQAWPVRPGILLYTVELQYLC